jgi:hypothetical protein
VFLEKLERTKATCLASPWKKKGRRTKDRVRVAYQRVTEPRVETVSRALVFVWFAVVWQQNRSSRQGGARISCCLARQAATRLVLLFPRRPSAPSPLLFDGQLGKESAVPSLTVRTCTSHRTATGDGCKPQAAKTVVVDSSSAQGACFFGPLVCSLLYAIVVLSISIQS